MLKLLASVAMVLVVAVSAVLLYRANLIVRAETPIFESMPGGPTPEHRIAILRPGEKLTVYSCIDNKRFAGYEIRLRDGRTGYVLAGNAEVEKKAFLFPPYSSPIVWNCL